jgi:hypothetical protein
VDRKGHSFLLQQGHAEATRGSRQETYQKHLWMTVDSSSVRVLRVLCSLCVSVCVYCVLFQCVISLSVCFVVLTANSVKKYDHRYNFRPRRKLSLSRLLICCSSLLRHIYIRFIMSADTLDAKSRDFFERAKLKQTASLTFAGIGLLFFGMAVEDGGQSNSATIMEDATSGDTKDMYEALSSGYGFSCFVKLLACLLAFAVSLYFSTFFCG